MSNSTSLCSLEDEEDMSMDLTLEPPNVDRRRELELSLSDCLRRVSFSGLFLGFSGTFSKFKDRRRSENILRSY